MEASATDNHDARPPVGAAKTSGAAVRRTASRFLAVSLFAMGGAGSAASVASASPAEPDPFEPHEVTVELAGPIDVTPEFVLPEAPAEESEEEPAGHAYIPDVTVPELEGPIDVTPDFVLPEGDAADPADEGDLPAEGAYDDGEGDVPAEGAHDDGEGDVPAEGAYDDGEGDVPAEGTYDDSEGDVPAEGTYDDGEGQVTGEATAESVAQRTPRHRESSLAFTGSNSLLLVVGAGVLLAGALVAGLSVLARRAAAGGGA